MIEIIYGYEEYVGMLIGASIYLIGLFIYRKRVRKSEEVIVNE